MYFYIKPTSTLLNFIWHPSDSNRPIQIGISSSLPRLLPSNEKFEGNDLGGPVEVPVIRQFSNRDYEIKFAWIKKKSQIDRSRFLPLEIRNAIFTGD